MNRTTLPLSLALAVSVLMNVMLWRRAPQPVPEPVARPAAAASASAAAPVVEASPEVAQLREENRKLKDQLTAAKVSLDLKKSGPQGGNAPGPEQPEAREYEVLFAALHALIENRKVQGVDPDGNPVTFEKQVLTPQNREAAIRVLAEYAAPDDATRRWFSDRAEAAIQQYWRTREEEDRDSATVGVTLQGLQTQERAEEIAALQEKLAERSRERFARWEHDHLDPMRKTLDTREGVRPALMSRHLGDLLWQLITPDER